MQLLNWRIVGRKAATVWVSFLGFAPVPVSAEIAMDACLDAFVVADERVTCEAAYTTSTDEDFALLATLSYGLATETNCDVFLDFALDPVAVQVANHERLTPEPMTLECVIVTRAANLPITLKAEIFFDLDADGLVNVFEASDIDIVGYPDVYRAQILRFVNQNDGLESAVLDLVNQNIDKLNSRIVDQTN